MVSTKFSKIWGSFLLIAVTFLSRFLFFRSHFLLFGPLPINPNPLQKSKKKIKIKKKPKTKTRIKLFKALILSALAKLFSSCIFHFFLISGHFLRVYLIKMLHQYLEKYAIYLKSFKRSKTLALIMQNPTLTKNLKTLHIHHSTPYLVLVSRLVFFVISF